MRSPVSQRSICAFSLIELLAVISIVVVMIGMGAYIFSGDSSAGAAISTSATQVSTAISGARQIAVTNNCRTRFAILTRDEANKDEWRLRTYMVLKEVPGGSLTAERRFIPVTSLEQLRAGIFFQRDNETVADPTTGAGRQMLDRIATMGLQDIPAAEYSYIEFLPTGATTTGTSENILMLERGLEAGVSLPNNHNYARIGVSQHTGRVRVERP